MSESDRHEIGSIIWTDLSVPNAEEVKDFYREVVGWEANDYPMGDHNDFTIHTPASGKTVAGICHTRDNTNLPSQWLVYIIVADLDRSVTRCVELGGQLISGPNQLGHDRWSVIQDPAGAVIALYEQAT